MEVGQTISQQCQPCGSFLWETDKFLGGCSCSCSLSHQRAGLSDKTICWKNPARDPRAKKPATSCRKARLVKLVARSPTLHVGVNSTCTQSTRRRVCHWLVKKQHCPPSFRSALRPRDCGLHGTVGKSADGLRLAATDVLRY